MGGIKTIIADGGYRGDPLANWVKENCSWKLEVVKRNEPDKFKVINNRWIVERTFAWISFSRRASKDYEKLPETSQSITYLAMIRIFINRI